MRDSDATTPGIFLALDGPDGAGKSTQAARLVDFLRAAGLDVVPCRDPGGTPLGDRLRALLLDHGDATPIGLRAEMLLYMASRAQLVDDVVRPALDAGKIVVSDRYLLANVVYQGHAGGLDPADLWRVGRVATAGLMPHLTLVLDVPTEVAQARLAGRPADRIEARPPDYHRRVRSGFLRELKSLRAPFLLIDASEDPDTVARKVQNEVARALGIPTRS
jgi:dTMP kinase